MHRKAEREGRRDGKVQRKNGLCKSIYEIRAAGGISGWPGEQRPYGVQSGWDPLLSVEPKLRDALCGGRDLRERYLASAGDKESVHFHGGAGKIRNRCGKSAGGRQSEYRDGAEVLLWMTSDFLRFERRPSFHVNAFGPAEKIFFRCCEKRNCYEICWQDSTGIWYRKETEALPENETLSGERWTGPEKETGDCAAVGSEIVTRACLRWNPVRHIRTMVPQSIRIRRWEDLSELRAEAVYSDGSVSGKSVRWELDQGGFQKEGITAGSGESFRRRHTIFPWPPVMETL